MPKTPARPGDRKIKDAMMAREAEAISTGLNRLDLLAGGSGRNPATERVSAA